MQNDIVVYDRQYLPLFYELDGVLTIPAESVYAVFEVKQTLNKRKLADANEKARSVRNLTRTSVEVVTAGGVLPRQDPSSKPILAGILATHIGWQSLECSAAQTAILGGGASGRLDFVVAANIGAVERREDDLAFAPTELRLAWLQVRLLKRLLALGTALPLDIDAYWNAIEAKRSAETLGDV